MTEEGKQRGALGTAIVQYFVEKPSSFKDLMVIIVVAIGVFVISARYVAA